MYAVNISRFGIARVAALAALLLLQMLALNFVYDSWQLHLYNSGRWFEVIAYAGQITRALVVIPVFLLLSLWPRLPGYLQRLEQSLDAHPWMALLGAQLAVYGALFWLSDDLFSADIHDPVGSPLSIAWLAAVAATGALWVLAVAPLRFWREFIRAEKTALVLAAGLGLCAWWLAVYAQTLWTPLSDLTFSLSSTLLELLYPEVIVDPANRILGAGDFIVNIAPQCSGYEGMGLMLAFTAVYLSLFRRDFRFPRALLLLPLGIAVIWLFNNLRIAALIAVGISWSPAVAVGGFHSQAGWISFILVIVLTLSLAHHTPYFQRAAASSGARRGRGLNLPMATLIPFIVLLAATMLSNALSAGFDWLYPLRVIAVALALGFCWRWYAIEWRLPGSRAWIAGALVFVAWILLVQNDAEADAAFGAALGEASWTAAGAWLLLRTLGAVITVPIAEELVFRGYLLARLAGQPVDLERKPAFAWIPLLVSSLLFGLLHADWLAGVCAGLVYGVLRYRSGSIRDAIAAHAFTNLLLSVYVITTGQWSLW